MRTWQPPEHFCKECGYVESSHWVGETHYYVGMVRMSDFPEGGPLWSDDDFGWDDDVWPLEDDDD